jgi:hypothetical protein
LSTEQAWLRKNRGSPTRNHIANIKWIIERADEFQQELYFCFIDYSKAFDCVQQARLEYIRSTSIPEHLIKITKSLYKYQEATI